MSRALGAIGVVALLAVAGLFVNRTLTTHSQNDHESTGSAATSTAATDLHVVACGSATSCVAVGTATPVANGSQQSAIAEHWDGNKWSTQPAVSPAADTELKGIACTGPNSCVAVGSAGDPNRPESQQALIENWDGKHWSTVKGGQPRATSSLQSVTCPSPASCIAVGWVQPAGAQASSGPEAGAEGAVALVEFGHGAEWTVVQTPSLPAGAGAWLQGIGCANPDLCFAVGLLATHDAIDGNQTLVEKWDGRTWSIVPSPSPSSPGAELNELASTVCTASAKCLAAGYYDSGDVYNSHQLGLVESWDGTGDSHAPSPSPGQTGAWTVVADASGAGVKGSFESIGCASLTYCVAVGRTNEGSAEVHPLAEQWDGTSWSTRPELTVSGAFESVACPSPTRCVAVGTEMIPTNPSGRALIKWLSV